MKRNFFMLCLLSKLWLTSRLEHNFLHVSFFLNKMGSNSNNRRELQETLRPQIIHLALTGGIRISYLNQLSTAFSFNSDLNTTSRWWTDKTNQIKGQCMKGVVKLWMQLRSVDFVDVELTYLAPLSNPASDSMVGQ